MSRDADVGTGSFEQLKGLIEGAGSPKGKGRVWPGLVKNGIPRPNLKNMWAALRYLDHYEYAYNEFLCRAEVRLTREHAGVRLMKKKVGEPVSMSDGSLADLRQEVIETFKFEPETSTLAAAWTNLARERPYHPVIERLDGFKWDGVKRLDVWLEKGVGARPSKYEAAVGRIFLIAAVRRVKQPGCKFDTALVLVGKTQGRGKSTVILILALNSDWFSDQDILAQKVKEQMEQAEGIWMHELPELESTKRRDAINRVKSHLSRRWDTARMAYGRFSERRKRQHVYAATVNEITFLSDPTGNRRFLPITTNRIDLDWMSANVEQLWAEAVVAERNDEPTTLPEDLWAEAARVQQAHTSRDPWLDILAEFKPARGEVARYHSIDLLLGPLNCQQKDLTGYHSDKLRQVMTDLGFEFKRSLRIKDKINSGYVMFGDASQPGRSRRNNKKHKNISNAPEGKNDGGDTPF